MSVQSAYPPKEFENLDAALSGFATLVQEGFENHHPISGTMRLTISDVPEYQLIAEVGDGIKFLDQSDQSQNIDADVSMPRETLERIFRDFEYLDFRDPSLIGTISIDGDPELVQMIGRSCLRPTDRTIALFDAVGELHAAKEYKNLVAVEYMEDPSQLKILEAIEESRPIVIPARDGHQSNWNTERLIDEYGEIVILVHSANEEQTMREFVAEMETFERCQMPLGQKGVRKPYTLGSYLPKEMHEHFGPQWFDQRYFNAPQLWFGSVPTDHPSTPLHRDMETGFLLQVIGRKRLDLYSADQAELLSPWKAYNNYQPCWFEPHAPDFETFPNAKNAKSISVILEPGDMIIQPAGWFHQVYTIDSPNMSVSHFWRF